MRHARILAESTSCRVAAAPSITLLSHGSPLHYERPALHHPPISVPLPPSIEKTVFLDALSGLPETITERRLWHMDSPEQWVAEARCRVRDRYSVDVTSRVKALNRVAALLRERETDLLEALKADLGKPAFEAWASEIGFLLSDIRDLTRRLRRWSWPVHRRVPLMLLPATARVVRRPYGVALVMGPWNYPLQLLLCPAMAALAAGNAVLLKPSELAPHTAAWIERWLPDAVGRDRLRVATGGPETAKALLKTPFDYIFFTGSTAIGKHVMRAAANNLTPVTLELGGKCPCIVSKDADLTVAARRICRGKFMNAGQTCVAPDYVLVHASCHDALIDALRNVITQQLGADPRENPSFGRIVNPQHTERLGGYLKCGTIAAGGRVDIEQRYVAPTILTNVPAGSPVLNEEIFGPILPVIAVDSLEHAIATVNAGPRPLALYLFTSNPRTRAQIANATDSGGICINDTVVQLIPRELPFGGVGHSGMGRYHGKASLDTFSYQRSILRRSLRADSRRAYPPYGTRLSTLKRFYALLSR